MNRMKKNMVFLFLLSCASFAFAEVDCPPTDLVTNLPFLKAYGGSGIWDLYPNSFNYANRNWQAIFTVYLPEAHNAQEAIQQGDEFFKTSVVFFDPPMSRINGDQQICYYAQQESSYFVRAKSSLSKG